MIETQASASTCMSMFQTKPIEPIFIEYLLNIQQIFTPCLPGLCTVLDTGNITVTKTDKGPLRMGLTFKWGRAE